MPGTLSVDGRSIPTGNSGQDLPVVQIQMGLVLPWLLSGAGVKKSGCSVSLFVSRFAVRNAAATAHVSAWMCQAECDLVTALRHLQSSSKDNQGNLCKSVVVVLLLLLPLLLLMVMLLL